MKLSPIILEVHAKAMKHKPITELKVMLSTITSE